MGVHELPRDRETETGSVEGFLTPLEWLEKPLRLARIDSGTLVRDVDLHSTLGDRHTDHDGATGRSVLDSRWWSGS